MLDALFGVSGTLAEVTHPVSCHQDAEVQLLMQGVFCNEAGTDALVASDIMPHFVCDGSLTKAGKFASGA